MFGREFIVRGRVQGVSFRAHTREQAVRLQLTGSALNCADGSVRVQAFGCESALAELAVWLQHGPRLAQVQSVQTREIEPPPQPSGFRIGNL